MPGGQFLELLLLKWSDFDNSKIAAGHFTHNYGLDLDKPNNRCNNIFQAMVRTAPLLFFIRKEGLPFNANGSQES